MKHIFFSLLDHINGQIQSSSDFRFDELEHLLLQAYVPGFSIRESKPKKLIFA